MTAVAVTRLNLPMNEFKRFSDAYGYNILDDKNADILIKVRELSMLTWLSQNKGQTKAIDREIDHRIKTLREDDRYTQWNVVL